MHTHACVDGGRDGKVDKWKRTYTMDKNWVHVRSNKRSLQQGFNSKALGLTDWVQTPALPFGLTGHVSVDKPWTFSVATCSPL